MSKGPFKTSVLYVKECNKTSLPRPSLEYNSGRREYVEIVTRNEKRNIIDFRFAFAQHKTPLVMKITGYIWVNNKWKLQFSFPEIGCGNSIFSYFTKALHITNDTKGCLLEKGEYIVKNVDLNRMEHILTSEREYGRTMWKTEYMTKYNTVACFVLVTLVEPANK
ncbi:hypothetical protein evm_006244 [Chilo suppressalis]|nr:hypothetical protein evm_006244 [Chilo suppressalis]